MSGLVEDIARAAGPLTDRTYALVGLRAPSVTPRCGHLGTYASETVVKGRQTRLQREYPSMPIYVVARYDDTLVVWLTPGHTFLGKVPA